MKQRADCFGWMGASVLVALTAGAVGVAGQQSVSVSEPLPVVSLSLELVYEVGGFGAPEWAEFVSLDRASFGPDGRLLLMDANGNRAVVVDREGQLVVEHDDQGDGPGEFRGLVSAAAMEDGRDLFYDIGRRRFILRDDQGGEDFRLPEEAGLPWTLIRGSGSGVIGLPMTLTTGRDGKAWLSESGARSASEGYPITRYSGFQSGETVVAEVIARAPVREAPEGTGVLRAFDFDPTFGVFPDGSVAFAAGDAWRVEVIEAGGGRTVLTRSVTPRRTTDRDRDYWQEERGEARQFVMGGGGATPRRAPEPWFNPVIPAIRRIAVDASGRIWVERPGENPTQPGEVEIVTPDGRAVGRWDSEGRGLPDAFGPDGLAVWLEEGEFEVPIARVYRMTLGAGG